MNLKKRIGVLSLFSIIFIVTTMAVRIMIFAMIPGDSGLTLTLIVREFTTGLLFDIATLSYIIIPVGLYLLLAPKKLIEHRYHYCFIMTCFFIVIYVLIFDGVAEYLFFDEFSTRFNFIAVDYLIYTREVIGNILESYHVFPILGVILFVSFIITFMMRKIINNASAITFGTRKRKMGFVILAAPLAAFLFVNVSTPAISGNIYADEIGKNGIYSLFSAFHDNELDFTRFYLTDSDDSVLSELHSILEEKGSHFISPDRITRQIKSDAQEKKLNVIVVVEESLSASFLGCMGDNRDFTPNIDKLAGESLLFTHLYAAGTRTVRGLEAISLSMPPLPGISIVKRHDNSGFRSWGEIMHEKNYDTKFIYAGFGYFDNMSDFFGNNGYEVIDRNNFSNDEISFANVWGVCDEDLFDKVISESRKSFEKGQPFFSTVMTTSNHTPFSYPSGKIDVPSKTGGRKGGVKYADYAIGKFIEKASKEPWFNNTVFVFVADHCASSAGRTELPVKKYEIPLLIYSPKNIKPRRIDKLMSQIDIPPTVLGLLNFSYTSDFFGRDILKTDEKTGRAFVSTYQKLGYIENDRIAVLSPQKNATFYKFDRQSDKEEPLPMEESIIKKMQAYYQGANYIYKKHLNRIN
ncbi:LTA synthase family protein [Desulforegula conservatrix]|uniref:LTA synthase family protein n=1 Tax=Desulforegula conservatrix TaxID=153026 RepID=UPI0004867C7B|nr:LTA synthase family protein [Desulforegula conservatrix]